MDHKDVGFVWNYKQVVQNKQCSKCQDIVQTFNIWPSCLPSLDLDGYLQIDKRYRCWLLSLANKDGTPTNNRIYLVNPPEINDQVGFPAHECWIDISDVKNWITTCDQEHAGTCHSITDPWKRIDLADGLLFIDVERYCLVRQSQTLGICRYAALSYVWGATTDPFQTTVANFLHLCEENAFNLPANHERLPRIIMDSILLTRALNVRYLWVDRFCIIQDDQANKLHQLSSMASVYTNSYITIAATEGNNGDYGLPGLGIGKPQFQTFEQLGNAPGAHMIMRKETMLQVLDPPKYHQRGWTFQEWNLSRRRLSFSPGTLTWTCKHSDKDGLWERWPNNQVYLDLVQKYCQRILSDPADVLAAFDAIITVQGRTMVGGVLYGLPELFFRASLLWVPRLDHLLRRRTDLNGRVMKQFPSWSWSGWIGPIEAVEAMEISALTTPPRHKQYMRYIPIVEFYKAVLSSKSREIIQDIDHFGDEYCGLRMDNSMIPKRHTIRHTTIPLVDYPQYTSSHLVPKYSPIIEFRTDRCFLRVISHDSGKSRSKHAFITDLSHSVVGRLTAMPQFLEGGLPEDPVEFICIGKAEVSWSRWTRWHVHGISYLHRHCQDFCEDDRELCKLGPDWKCRYYYVLWIERDEAGIAYRKSIGKVWEEEWDRTEKQKVDIRLG